MGDEIKSEIKCENTSENTSAILLAWTKMNLTNDSSSDSSDEEETIRDFEIEAQTVINEKILPAKSVNRYNLVYETFMKWKNENKANSFEENILICYFKDLEKK